MCHYGCIVFGINQLHREEIEHKKILDVGSYDVNGSLRPFVENLKPAEYIGIDTAKGPGVDMVLSAEGLVAAFGKDYFDMVISTELLEHVAQWQTVVSNIKNVCRPGGSILITTRSYGFPYHPFPDDYWRYELEDMEKIFGDCEIITLEKDCQIPGVFIKVRKPLHFLELDMRQYALYNIALDKKIDHMPSAINSGAYLWFVIKKNIRSALVYCGTYIINWLS